MAPKLRDIDEKEVAQYALAGCYTKTIARLMKVPETTIRRRFKGLISEKRAERKYNLLVAQNKAVEKGNPALLIFLGKNILDQKDTKDIRTSGTISITLERECRKNESK